jgi:transposase-like protein
LLAQVENKDAESILGESGLAGQLKKMLAKRILSAELSHHLANEGEARTTVTEAARKKP